MLKTYVMRLEIKHHSVLHSPVRRTLSSHLLAKLELKYYSVLIPSAGIRGTEHHPMYALKASPQDYVGSHGPDLREFSANKRKSVSFRTTSPCCRQRGCQLVTIHSARCRSRRILATPPCRQSVFDRLSVHLPMKHRRRSTSRDPASASVNMTERGRELRGGSQTSDDTRSFPDPDYSPGLGEVLVHEEGVF